MFKEARTTYTEHNNETYAYGLRLPTPGSGKNPAIRMP
jgi:hypothetical protein